MENQMTWQQVSKRRQIMNMAVTDTHTFLVGQKGIFVSDSRGQKWKNHLKDVWFNHVWAQGNEVYAGACGALYYSSDSGKTWDVVRRKKHKWFGPFGGAGALRFHGMSGARNLFRQHPDNPKKWDKLSCPTGIQTIHVVGSQVWVGGRNGLVARSDDSGASWERRDPPYKTEYASMHIDDEQNIYIAGLTGEVRRSTDGGHSWCALDVYGRQIWGAGQEIYVLHEQTDTTVLHCSSDGGNSWTKHIEFPHLMRFLAGSSEQNIWVANYDGVVLHNG